MPILIFFLQGDKRMQEGFRARRATGHIHINGNNMIGAFHHGIRVVKERTTADRAGPIAITYLGSAI